MLPLIGAINVSFFVAVVERSWWALSFMGFLSVLCVGPQDISLGYPILVASFLWPPCRSPTQRDIKFRVVWGRRFLTQHSLHVGNQCFPRDQGKKLTGRIAAMQTDNRLCGLTDTPLISQPGALDMEWWVPRMRPFPCQTLSSAYDCLNTCTDPAVIHADHLDTRPHFWGGNCYWLYRLPEEHTLCREASKASSMVVLTGGPVLTSLRSWMRVESHPPCIVIRKEDTCRIFYTPIWINSMPERIWSVSSPGS